VERPKPISSAMGSGDSRFSLFKFDTMRDMERPNSFHKGIGVCYPLAIASNEIKKKFGGIDPLPTI
jgi:hypothetical protein